MWVGGGDGQVDGPMLKVKVERFAKKMGHNNFTATDGWIEC